jgi:DNA mismatch repair protein MutL
MISEMVGRLALARPEISFSLRHPQTLVLNTPGRGNLLDTIAAVLGNDTARKMLPLSWEESNLKISGYIGSPELVRASRHGVTLIVNCRVIRSQLLYQALKDGYHTLIPAGAYPFAVLALTMPPSAYDVNVHPSKLEIKFRDEKALAGLISDSIRKTLLKASPVRPLTATGAYPAGLSASRKPYQAGKTFDFGKRLDSKSDSGDRPNDQDTFHHGEQEAKEPDQEYAACAPENEQTLNFQELRAIGQLFNTYILCTDDRDFYILDQHAAHERIRYDELLNQLKDQGICSQMLLIPETVELTVQEEQIMLEYFDDLHRFGFIIEHFGERTYFLRAVPAAANLSQPGSLFLRFLDEILRKKFPPSQEKLLENWIYMIACRSALKGNERLSIQEMDEIIQTLGRRPNPLSCPHGRPTMIRISQKELQDRFNRT